MPVILGPADWSAWLGDGGDHRALLRPAPLGAVRLLPASRAVNSVRHNEAELLAPMVDAGPQTAEDAKVDANPIDEGSAGEPAETPPSYLEGLGFEPALGGSAAGLKDCGAAGR